MERRYELIVNEIRNYDPGLARQIREWYPVGEYEVVLVLDDGSKVQYEGLNHTYRWLADRVVQSDELLSEEEYKREFAYKLRRLMEANRHGQETLSRDTGISQSAISKYLRGEALPGYYNLMRICHALNCPVSELTSYVI